jgi:soluble lytic murein transglycosylase-like protein
LQFINSAATRFKVDPDLIHSVISIESNFNPKAISRRHAAGLMQLIPGTAAQMGVRNIFDPRENIEGGTRYLGELLHRYDNNLVLTLAAYNAGPEQVQKYGRVPPFAETISYVRKVQHTYQQRKSQAKPKSQPILSLDDWTP